MKSNPAQHAQFAEYLYPIVVSFVAWYSYPMVFSFPTEYSFPAIPCSAYPIGFSSVGRYLYPMVFSFSAGYSFPAVSCSLFTLGHLSGRNSCSCRWRSLVATKLRIESANSGLAQTIRSQQKCDPVF